MAIQRRLEQYIGPQYQRSRVTIRGRTLDEPGVMLRDAIPALWGQTNIHLELILAA